MLLCSINCSIGLLCSCKILSVVWSSKPCNETSAEVSLIVIIHTGFGLHFDFATNTSLYDGNISALLDFTSNRKLCQNIHVSTYGPANISELLLNSFSQLKLYYLYFFTTFVVLFESLQSSFRTVDKFFSPVNLAAYRQAISKLIGLFWYLLIWATSRLLDLLDFWLNSMLGRLKRCFWGVWDWVSGFKCATQNSESNHFLFCDSNLSITLVASFHFMFLLLLKIPIAFFNIFIFEASMSLSFRLRMWATTKFILLDSGTLKSNWSTFRFERNLLSGRKENCWSGTAHLEQQRIKKAFSLEKIS